MGRTFASIGTIQEFLGDYPKALESQGQALKLMEELGNRGGVAAKLPLCPSDLSPATIYK